MQFEFGTKPKQQVIANLDDDLDYIRTDCVGKSTITNEMFK